MGQIFHPATNTASRVSLLAAVLLVSAVAGIFASVIRSPYTTGVGVAREQPVEFSHKHHVAGLGIDCRYCHGWVEKNASAGMPSTKTCMSCHSQIWSESPTLEAVRESFRTGASIEWTRVHDLPDFVFFHHGVHVAKGVACVACHGRVDRMPLLWREETLHMEWCLDCHRHPEAAIGPRARVFEMEPGDTVEGGADRAEPAPDGDGILRLTNCSICHR
ncbi:MAG TPA: cytochrome c3 family protein [Planctomycetota bacterium]|nr:cytochrome c3 family protein [Planctomycetota bacterium]